MTITKRGAAKANARLSDIRVAYARRRAAQAAQGAQGAAAAPVFNLSGLARFFGVSPVALHMAIRGQTWKHVAEPPFTGPLDRPRYSQWEDPSPEDVQALRMPRAAHG